MANRIFQNAILLLLIFFIPFACKQNQPTTQKATTMTNSKISKTLLYVGTYTKKEGHVDGQAEGIYIFDYDTKTGSLTAVDTIPNTVNPSYLTVPPNGKYLYAVNEIAGNGNPSVGTVSAFELDEKGHFKRALNVVSAMGDAPCHISVDASEHYVLVANYMGSVAAFPIQKNGSLGAASSSVKHKLDNPGSGRQDAPHAHMILSGIDSTSVFAVDLGMDKVIHYELSAGQLTEQAKTALKEGAGGRHLVFHPSQKWVYVLNELNKTVGFFQYSNAATPFERLQTISTLEKPITEGDVGPSAIRIHPSGKFLYTANRGIQGNNNNSIATYSINAQSGQLAFLGLQAAKGAVPRDFAVSPDGQFLLVANQNSNTIVTFRIDEKTGELIETGIITEVKTPVCLQFFEK